MTDYPLRPYLPGDTMALRELFAQSIEELTAEDYDEDQRLAWVSLAADATAFAERLGNALTLVIHQNGEYLGFAALKDNKLIDMLYVHPHHAGEGVGSALAAALEKIAAARGSTKIDVDASDTAVEFFEGRGYEAMRRNSIPIDDEWLSNTTMSKKLEPVLPVATSVSKPS